MDLQKDMVVMLLSMLEGRKKIDFKSSFTIVLAKFLLL